MLTGVVEILTPSYEGGKNKDYWKGTLKSLNADSNDPWTLSNTLPMPKPDYAQAKIQFDKLRTLIGKNKGSSNVTNVIQTESVADEIEFEEESPYKPDSVLLLLARSPSI
jgi:hypothetical protein